MKLKSLFSGPRTKDWKSASSRLDYCPAVSSLQRPATKSLLANVTVGLWGPELHVWPAATLWTIPTPPVVWDGSPLCSLSHNMQKQLQSFCSKYLEQTLRKLQFCWDSKAASNLGWRLFCLLLPLIPQDSRNHFGSTGFHRLSAETNHLNLFPTSSIALKWSFLLHTGDYY